MEWSWSGVSRQRLGRLGDPGTPQSKLPIIVSRINKLGTELGVLVMHTRTAINGGAYRAIAEKLPFERYCLNSSRAYSTRVQAAQADRQSSSDQQSCRRLSNNKCSFQRPFTKRNIRIVRCFSPSQPIAIIPQLNRSVMTSNQCVITNRVAIS